MVTGHRVVQFCLQSYSWLTNRTPASRSPDFVNHWNDYRPNYTQLVLLPLLVSFLIIPIDSSLIRAKEGFKNITMLTTVLRKHQFSEPVSLVDIEFLPWLFIFFFEKIKKKKQTKLNWKSQNLTWNVNKKSGTRDVKRVCHFHWCSYHASFDAFCDLVVNRRTATWKSNGFNDVIVTSLL